MDTCVNLSTLKNYHVALNAWSRQYSNWTISKIPFRWMRAKQCYANDFTEIVSIPSMNQNNTLLANTQYLFSMVILWMILLLFRRATTSITKDDALGYLIKDVMALLKLLHWKNCDYSNIAFTTSCFLVFIAMLPILLTLWLCMLCYRQYIRFVIEVSVGLHRM